MTITRLDRCNRRIRLLVFGMLAMPALGAVCSAQSRPATNRPAPVVIRSVPSARFQQSAQQQHVRDQWQKSQQQEKLRQSVSDNAKRPSQDNTQAQQQIEQADRARQDRAHAAQQDMIDRQRNNNELPRVVPRSHPAPARSGG
jgi:flagellar biosynthesis GTPase FlhF